MKQGGIRLAAVKQLTKPEEIVARIREIYVPNHFMSDYFHIDIDDIRCGKVTVSLRRIRENTRTTERCSTAVL